MIAFLRKWISGVLALCALLVGAWWFFQQTASYRQVDALVRSHPAVASEVGKVTGIQLPFFGWGIDWTDTHLDPRYDVRVSGTEGSASVHVEFRGDAVSDAWMTTEGGDTVPLMVAR